MKFTTQSEALVWAQMMAAALAGLEVAEVELTEQHTAEHHVGIVALIADAALEEYRKRGGA